MSIKQEFPGRVPSPTGLMEMAREACGEYPGPIRGIYVKMEAMHYPEDVQERARSAWRVQNESGLPPWEQLSKEFQAAVCQEILDNERAQG